VAAAYALLAWGGAHADVLPGSGFEIAGWDGAARIKPTGEFAYCVVHRNFPNGIELSLARSPEGLFFLGLKHAAWVLPKGIEAKARVAIDGAAGRTETAMVIAGDTVLFTFWPQDAATYSARLDSATRLTIADLSVAPQPAEWAFDLTGTHEALDALGRCVAEHGKTGTASVRK
jgi:hypothetical protein